MEPTRQQCLNDLRMMIDGLEAHPTVPLPMEISGWHYLLITALNTKDEAIALAKEFGECDKIYDDDTFRLEKRFGSQCIRAFFQREQVCERVVVGTKEIPERIRPSKVIAAHTQEIVEWRCSSLLAPENTTVEVAIV